MKRVESVTSVGSTGADAPAPEVPVGEPFVENDVGLSIVLPFFNEEENIDPMITRVRATLDSLEYESEVVCVDDGSTDRTFSLLCKERSRDGRIKIVKLQSNFGQTAALAAGFDHARGEIIIPMDGDLQYHPEDIPDLLVKMGEGYDVVSGWRKNRNDPFFSRKLPSLIANRLMAKLSGIQIHDFGCTFKAYRRNLIKEVRLYGQLHRFIPVLAQDKGASIAEVPVQLSPRERGKSKYGITRTFTVLFDLIRLKFLSRFLSHPLEFFGLLGILLGGAGFGLACYLLYEKLIHQVTIMTLHGPLLFTSVLLLIMGVQFLSIGLLGEIMIKIYFENNRPYVVDETFD